jgi:hypothetical protein
MSDLPGTLSILSSHNRFRSIISVLPTSSFPQLLISTTSDTNRPSLAARFHYAHWANVFTAISYSQLYVLPPTLRLLGRHVIPSIPPLPA